MAISSQKSEIITVDKASEKESQIKIYSLKTKNKVYQQKIFGDFIKMKEAEQNPNGKIFAAAFFDDGLFRIRIFNTSLSAEKAYEVKINELLGLDRSTMVISDFPDPFITCCWVDEYGLFVNLFHPKTLTHYHFIWDICYKKIVGISNIDNYGKNQHHDKPILVKMTENPKNFPYKCFFDPKNKVVHSFYRYGNSFRINIENLADF
jgi:hypothetical protein